MQRPPLPQPGCGNGGLLLPWWLRRRRRTVRWLLLSSRRRTMAIAHRMERLKIGFAALCGVLLTSAIAAADPVPVRATFKIPGNAVRLNDPYREVSKTVTANRIQVSSSVLSFDEPIFDEYIPLADSDFTEFANLPPHTTVGLEVKGGPGWFGMGGAATSFACPLGGVERACVSANQIGGAMPIHARIRLGT